MAKKKKELIVVSGINLFEGGPLTIMQEVLLTLSTHFSKRFRIIALVHSKNLYNVSNVKLLEFPKSRKSWSYRLFYEYYYFSKLSKKLNVDYWLSMHDISPNVICKNQFVYCHNASPYFKPKLKDILYGFSPVLFSLFYKYLYGINIKRNKNVIVQQQWIRNRFESTFKINNVIVAYPEIKTLSKTSDEKLPKKDEPIKLFYPSYPRSFKNFELICEAYSLIPLESQKKMMIYLTLDRNLNAYAKKIISKFKNYQGIKFVGLITREEVYKYYQLADGLIFPSRLETWGLPITEFKSFKKPIFLADLPYAHETLGEYDKAVFFDPYSPKELAQIMNDFIHERLVYNVTEKISIREPFVQTWVALFNRLLND